ncbi:glycosyltransferase family 4 protein [Aquipuribacter sp. SD81]|uniref:glycosyltransferase family 4 protein n=1 Tax=Aquipuribacter sp. SD81 TaxID=3127703 RepID=UPI0030171F87
MSAAPGTDRPAGPARRLRILHLGFEDWRKPGSGGGAVRTREVNERLARHHDVTVLVSRYRGARERVENGVRWVPVGLPLGYFGGMVSYLLSVPFAARRRRADLLVEDFAAPVGSVLPAWWSRLPRVAVVQWLNAEEKARQYHLPFDRVQAAGVRRHDRFVAMSEDLGARLAEGNPGADVHVVPNGVPVEAFGTQAPKGDDVVFLGRLEIAQKGLDLLLDAWAAAAPQVAGRLVLLGDGPDRRELERRAARLGVADRVDFAGRVEGADKLRRLAAARVVVMPSRFETFGMVAAEAHACGTPVVAFGIPCLREVVVPGTGVLVPAFDTGALAREVVALLRDPARADAMGAEGRRLARRYDWDVVASQQEEVYLSAVGDGPA